MPVLLERLNTISAASDGDYRVGLIAKAFANLARQENVDLNEAIDSLLNAPSRDQQKVAIAALTAVPDARRLDRLWEIHQQRLGALEDKTDGSRHDDYRASSAALRAGVALDPTWLRNRILAEDAREDRASELGYLLNGLEHHDAPAIWKEAGGALMAKVPASKPRSLLYCIARFSDRDKLDFVVKQLSRSEDSAGGAALMALSVLDPLAAIDRLTEVKDFELYVTRNHWLPAVLHVQPKLTRERIRELAKSDPKGHRKIEDLFWERPDDIDEPMLRFVLRALERGMQDSLDEDVAGDPIWLCNPLEFLGRIVRPELLAILEAEAGGELERLITVIACSRLRTNSDFRDHVRENARRVLILMGGEGITTLIKRELESEHYWVRHTGLIWALIRGDDGVIERLTAIARRPLPRDASGKPESEPYLEFHQAITALAALGPDDIFVDTLWQTGMAEVPINLATLRAYRGPLPKTLTEVARRTLKRNVLVDHSLLTALVITELSGDADLIPAARSVLGTAVPESRVARYACIALQQLGDQSDDFARLALRLAQTEENTACGLNALVSLGDHGLEFLGNWLKTRKAMKHTEDDDLAIRALYGNPATRTLSVDAALDQCLHWSFLLNVPYDIAAESAEPTLRGQILEKAFASQSFTPTVTFRAIEGLAKFDTTRAVEAIEIGLQSHQKIERQLCRLLARIVPERAPAKLIDAAISVERKSLRHAVGRVLRGLDPEVVSHLIIERMNGLASERKAVVKLAGGCLPRRSRDLLVISPTMTAP